MCMAIMGIAYFAVTPALPLLTELAGNVVFLRFGGICTTGVSFGLAFVRETKGKPLEEMEAKWSRWIPVSH